MLNFKNKKFSFNKKTTVFQIDEAGLVYQIITKLALY